MTLKSAERPLLIIILLLRRRAVQLHIIITITNTFDNAKIVIKKNVYPQ